MNTRTTCDQRKRRRLTRRAARDLSRTGLEALDRRLAELGRGVGAVRLRIGEGLERLGLSGGHRELGFPSFGAYANERCERGARWAGDSRALVRRLVGLPRVRDALGTGVISWSAAEVVARYATEETEAQLVEEARRTTVRALEAKLAAAKEKVGEGEEVERRKTIEITVERDEAWAFEHTRMLIGAMTGDASMDTAVEAMLAEAATEIQTRRPDVRIPEWPAAPARDVVAECERTDLEVFCEGLVGREVPEPTPWVEEAWPTGARELDARIRELCAELACRDLELGELALRFMLAGGPAKLHWASEYQYARERIGISWSSLQERLSLARRVEDLPAIGEALADGRIGFGAAVLVGRVANAKTVKAWLARAGERTIKHLREEVEAVETIARAEDVSDGMVPPTEEDMERYFALESRVLSGDIYRMESGQDSGSEVDTIQMSVSPKVEGGTVTMRLRLREDVVRYWRAVEQAWRRAGLAGPFVAFLCRAVWRAWAHTLGPKGPFAEVTARDRWRCACPVCRDRVVTTHHIVFRSRGGGDEAANLTAACDDCHVFGIHEGRLAVSGQAPRATWEIGRVPVMRVTGRTRQLL